MRGRWERFREGERCLICLDVVGGVGVGACGGEGLLCASAPAHADPHVGCVSF